MKIKKSDSKKIPQGKSAKTKFKIGKSIKACKVGVGKSSNNNIDQIYNDVNFIDISNASDYMEIDEFESSFTCSICRKNFDSKVKLNQHVLKKHKHEVETCASCNISFFDKSTLDIHRQKHTTRKQNVLKCSLCPQAFFNRSRLISHEANHGIDRGDEGLPLENYNIQNVDLPSHSDEFVGFENMFTCEICTKSFEKRFSLDRHRLSHFKDCKGCKETDSDPKLDCPSVIQNYRSRSVLKFSHCKYCNKVFANSDILERHVALHEQNEKKKKYVCKYCQKRYIMPEMLFTHFRKFHKLETPFVCLYCDKYFHKRQEFSHHIKYIHQNVGTIKFDKNYSIVYGTTIIPSETQIQNLTFDIHNSSLDSCFHETRFLDVNTDDFIDIDSSNLDEISLDTDCFNSEKNNDLVSMIANMDTNTDSENYVVFNDDILDILESAKSDELTKDNCDSLIPMEEVLTPNILKDDVVIPARLNNTKAQHNEKDMDGADCNVCGINLKKKLVKSNVSTKFKCYLCLMGFRTKIKLDLHVKNHFQNDKTLCICGVKCGSDHELAKHKEQCIKSFFSFKSDKQTNNVSTNDSDDSDVDPLNDDSIVIFNAEQNACVILKDSIENRNCVNDTNNLKSIYRSVDIPSVSSKSYIESSPILFKKPIETPHTKVIIKRITKEEAALKQKLVIKAISIEEKGHTDMFNYKSSLKVTVTQTPVTITPSNNIESNEERVLVNVNPLAHLLPAQEQNVLKRKSYARIQKLDYASIIEKSLNNIIQIKKNE